MGKDEPLSTLYIKGKKHRSKIIVQTHEHINKQTDGGPIALTGQLKWNVITT